jgi:hypothetical protein
MNQRYADALDSLMFSRMHDNYFAQEIRSAQREANVNHNANWIAQDVIQTTPDNAHRRAAFIEEVIDGEGFIHLLGDLLDDLAAGINPAETLQRAVKSWAEGVATYEDERGEA